jgi:hypothetical protein
MSPPSSTAPSSRRRDRVTIDTARGYELNDETPTNFDRKMNAIQDNKHVRRLIETIESKCSPDVLRLVGDSIRASERDQPVSVYEKPLRELDAAVTKYRHKNRLELDDYDNWSVQNVLTEAEAWIRKNSTQSQVGEASSRTERGNESG